MDGSDGEGDRCLGESSAEVFCFMLLLFCLFILIHFFTLSLTFSFPSMGVRKTYEKIPSLLPTFSLVQINKIIISKGRLCFGISSKGHLFSWGRGGLCLGHGDTEDIDSPRVVQALEGMGVLDVSIGTEKVIALVKSGEVYTWGKEFVFVWFLFWCF